MSDTFLKRLTPIILCFTCILAQGQSTGEQGGGSTQPSPGYKFVGAGSTTVGVTGNVVTVSSSGGGGGDVFTASNNTFYGTLNTFSNNVNFLGTVTNFSGLIVTGSYDSVKGILTYGGGATNIFLLNGTAYDSSQRLAINWNGRTLNRDGGQTVVDFQNGTYNAEDGTASILTTTSNRKLRKGTTTILDWGNQLLNDNGGVQVMDWNARITNVGWTNRGSLFVTNSLVVNPWIAVNTNGVDDVTTVGYLQPAVGQTRAIFKVHSPNSLTDLVDIRIGDQSQSAPLFIVGTDGLGNVRFFSTGGGLSDTYLNTAGVIMWRANASTLTLGASSASSIIFNGATHTIAHTPQVNTDVWKWASAGGTLTNGTSLVVANEFTTSNINIHGGIKINPSTKTANYTNTVRDSYISWIPAVAAPTNFFLATPPDGTLFTVKDANLSAFTTNITIKPLGSDTVEKATSIKLLQNGEAGSFRYNATTANWERF